MPVLCLAAGWQSADSARAAQNEPVSSAPPSAPKAAPNQPETRQIECVAKVIVHEAGNQMRRGQIAVAQVIRTRMQKMGIAKDACRVVNQPGQFFNIGHFKPDRNSAQWHNALAIAAQTLRGEGKDVVPGAMFFRTPARPMKGRIRLTQIEGHVFYR